MNRFYLSNHTLTPTTKSVFIALSLLVGLSMRAQPGSLDTTFNSTGPQPGVIETSIGSNGADSYAVVIQPDDKIIAAGTDSNNFALARYTSDGSLDTTFNSSGSQPGVVVTTIGSSTTSAVNALALQSDGNIIAAGTDGFNFVIARYLANGTLDTTFNSAGSQPGVVVTTIGSSTASAIYGVAIQTDGKIVAAGTDGSNFVVARYTTSGTLDTTFYSAGTQQGVVVTSIGTSTNSAVDATAIQQDGKIVAIGTDGLNFVVARYTHSGSLDTTSFNSAGTQPGVVVTSFDNGAFAYAGAIQANGRIVAAGVAFDGLGNQNFALARYLTDGSLDNTFGINGIVITTMSNNHFFSANAVTIQDNGKIVAAGRFTAVSSNEQFALARYTHSGALDSTFGTNGVVTTTIATNAVISGLGLQADGKIIAAGAAGTIINQDSFAVARYIAH